MGSYWAYYELGWGGFWFWDPVENASLHAVARGDRAAPFGDRHGEARRAEDLDGAPRHPHLLAVACSAPSSSAPACSPRCTPSPPTRRAASSSSPSSAIFIGGALALFAFRAGTLAPGGIFAPISREGALILNNLFLTAAAGDGARRHALSAGARGADRRHDLGRRAVLQPDLRAADHAAAPHRAVRADARLEARRPPRRRRAADVRLRRRRSLAGDRRRVARRRRNRSLALFGVAARRLADRRRAVGDSRSASSSVSAPLGREPPPRSPACRARPSARRSPMPASA